MKKKMKKTGEFCGYRSIQMMVTYLNASAPSASPFNGGVPSILAIQDMIEDAWDSGIRPEGRIETGGIKGTRKYIGTPEVEALFTNLEIP